MIVWGIAIGCAAAALWFWNDARHYRASAEKWYRLGGQAIDAESSARLQLALARAEIETLNATLAKFQRARGG